MGAISPFPYNNNFLITLKLNHLTQKQRGSKVKFRNVGVIENGINQRRRAACNDRLYARRMGMGRCLIVDRFIQEGESCLHA